MSVLNSLISCEIEINYTHIDLIDSLIYLLQDHIIELLQEHLSDYVEVACKEPLLYGDYRTALQPEQPRLYEDLQDYEAARGLFGEVCYSTMVHGTMVHWCMVQWYTGTVHWCMVHWYTGTLVYYIFSIGRYLKNTMRNTIQ